MKKKKKESNKKGERPWLWRVGPNQGRGLGGEWALCLGHTGLEKALGALGVGA